MTNFGTIASIASEAAGLFGVVVELIESARAANDPSRLRRVREVITGELEVERVMREGEEAAKRLQGGE